MSETFAMLKPDALKEGLGSIIRHQLLDAEFTILKERLVFATREQLDEHYAHLVDKPFYESVCAYMQSGPCYAMLLEAPDAVTKLRSLVGDTNPLKASKTSIRGRYGRVGEHGTIYNVIHASDSEDAVIREEAIWL